MEISTANSILPDGTTPYNRISDLISHVIHTYHILRRETDLTSANPIVKEHISTLANRIRLQYTPEEVQMVMGDKHIKELHRGLLTKLSEAECKMELVDSRRLCGQPELELSALRKYENWGKYDALVRLELEQLRKLSISEDADTSIIFVGSGSLPLSAVLLHLLENVNVFCLEIDSDACNTSSVMLERIGLGDKVHVIKEDGANFNYKPFQRIFIASLVPNKHKVLEQIRRTRADALIAVRTAEGMRQLMYEAIDEENMEQEGWQLLARTSPMGSMAVNSTLFYRRASV